MVAREAVAEAVVVQRTAVMREAAEEADQVEAEVEELGAAEVVQSNAGPAAEHVIKVVSCNVAETSCQN